MRREEPEELKSSSAFVDYDSGGDQQETRSPADEEARKEDALK